MNKFNVVSMAMFLSCFSTAQAQQSFNYTGSMRSNLPSIPVNSNAAGKLVANDTYLEFPKVVVDTPSNPTATMNYMPLPEMTLILQNNGSLPARILLTPALFLPKQPDPVTGLPINSLHYTIPTATNTCTNAAGNFILAPGAPPCTLRVRFRPLFATIPAAQQTAIASMANPINATLNIPYHDGRSTQVLSIGLTGRGMRVSRPVQITPVPSVNFTQGAALTKIVTIKNICADPAVTNCANSGPVFLTRIMFSNIPNANQHYEITPISCTGFQMFSVNRDWRFPTTTAPIGFRLNPLQSCTVALKYKVFPAGTSASPPGNSINVVHSQVGISTATTSQLPINVNTSAGPVPAELEITPSEAYLQTQFVLSGTNTCSAKTETLTLKNLAPVGGSNAVGITLALFGQPSSSPTSPAIAGLFSIVSDTCSGISLAPQNTCTFGIEFQPLAAGILNALLQVNYDDDGTVGGSGAQSITHALKGDCKVQSGQAASLAFQGNLALCPGSSSVISLTNTSLTGTLTPATATITGFTFPPNSGWAASSSGGSGCTNNQQLQPGNSCGIKVSNITGTAGSTLKVTYKDATASNLTKTQAFILGSACGGTTPSACAGVVCPSGDSFTSTAQCNCCNTNPACYGCGPPILVGGITIIGLFPLNNGNPVCTSSGTIPDGDKCFEAKIINSSGTVVQPGQNVCSQCISTYATSCVPWPGANNGCVLWRKCGSIPGGTPPCGFLPAGQSCSP